MLYYLVFKQIFTIDITIVIVEHVSGNMYCLFTFIIYLYMNMNISSKLYLIIYCIYNVL